MATVFAVVSPAGANELANPGFEAGNSMPSDWAAWGDGAFVWQTGGAHGGTRCMKLGGTSFALLYQRVPATPGVHYTVSAWSRYDSGLGEAHLKLEFHDAALTKLAEYPIVLPRSVEWTLHGVSEIAPAGAAYATASLVGEADGFVLFDDVSLTPADALGDCVAFDLAQTTHSFGGFGAQIWGYGPDANFPNLMNIRQQALAELNIRYVRIENYLESTPWADVQATRAITDALGIQWVYLIWGAPTEFRDELGRLRDDRIGEFADWWVTHVQAAYAHDVPVEYVELMNEPESQGVWSTGINAWQYNVLVQNLRPKLDAAGLGNVGIVGPGLSSMTWSDPAGYIYALDTAGVTGVEAWSTHAWGSDAGGGGPNVEQAWPYFAGPADTQDATKLKFVTEYATHGRTFHGITYPAGDDYGDWNASNVFPYFCMANCVPYAVRVYEATLALLNSGADVPFVWQAIDEPTEVNPPGYAGTKRKAWGLLDLWGTPKPVYVALRTLYPKVPMGARIVAAPDQTNNVVYAGAYVYGDRVIVGLANNSTLERDVEISLSNAPADLRVIEAVAFEQTYWGDPNIGEPDIGVAVARSITLTPDGAAAYSFSTMMPAESTLTVVCDVILPGDCDEDGDRDAADFEALLACLGEPENPPTTGCTCFDLDVSASVDMRDVSAFQRVFSGVE